jgi:hypothetical protein
MEAEMMTDAISVALDRESWQKIQALVLEMAVLIDTEGDPETAAHVLELLVPALTGAAGPGAESAEAYVRAELGVSPRLEVL